MYLHQAIVKQEEKTLENDRGILEGVSNDLAQPNKTCTVFDGDSITICVLKLDIPFPGYDIWDFGMKLHLNFVHSLRVATDGEVRVGWASNTPPLEEL